jgi:hypothetical protein
MRERERKKVIFYSTFHQLRINIQNSNSKFKFKILSISNILQSYATKVQMSRLFLDTYFALSMLFLPQTISVDLQTL